MKFLIGAMALSFFSLSSFSQNSIKVKTTLSGYYCETPLDECNDSELIDINTSDTQQVTPNIGKPDDQDYGKLLKAFSFQLGQYEFRVLSVFWCDDADDDKVCDGNYTVDSIFFALKGKRKKKKGEASGKVSSRVPLELQYSTREWYNFTGKGNKKVFVMPHVKIEIL